MGAGTLGPKGMGQGLSCSDTCTHRISWDLSSLREEGIMRLGTVMYSQWTMRDEGRKNHIHRGPDKCQSRGR